MADRCPITDGVSFFLPVAVFVHLLRQFNRLVLGTSIAALFFGAAGAALASTAVVLDSDDDSLSVVTSDGYHEVSRAHVGRAPHHLIVSPDGRTLLIAMSVGNELVFIDRSTGIEKQRMAASDPYQIGFSPDGKWFVAASLRLDRIDIYDANNFQVVRRLPAPTMPSHIAFARDSSTVYVTLQGTSSLIAVDLASGKALWTAPIGPTPAGIVTRPTGTLLAGIMGSDYIAEIDPHDGHIIQKIHTGNGAHNFLASPDGKTLYVTNRVAGTISVLDADTLAITATLTAPGGPDDMALSPDGKELWVTDRWHASVGVIELTSGALKTIPVGRSPHGIFVY